MQPAKTIKANKANISSPLVLLTDSFLIIFTSLLLLPFRKGLNQFFVNIRQIKYPNENTSFFITNNQIISQNTI